MLLVGWVAPLQGNNHQDEVQKIVRDGEASSRLDDASTDMAGGQHQVGAPPTRSLSPTDRSECQISPGSATQPTSNICRHGQHPTIMAEEETEPPKRVSFSPEVCELPKGQPHQRRHDVTLYIMLLAVAIAIAVFSLIPLHPSLSPIYSMTRDDILRRAESILSSQWDVEL